MCSFLSLNSLRDLRLQEAYVSEEDRDLEPCLLLVPLSPEPQWDCAGLVPISQRFLEFYLRLKIPFLFS